MPICPKYLRLGATFIADWESTGYPSLWLDRQMLLKILYDNLKHKDRVLTNKRVVHVEMSSTGVLVTTEDGSSYSGDILVGGDGVHSKVRQEMWRIASSGASSADAFPPEEKSSKCPKEEKEKGTKRKTSSAIQQDKVTPGTIAKKFIRSCAIEHEVHLRDLKMPSQLPSWCYSTGRLVSWPYVPSTLRTRRAGILVLIPRIRRDEARRGHPQVLKGRRVTSRGTIP